MHRPAHVADPFSMNQTKLMNPAFFAGFEIVRDQGLQIARMKRMEIEHAVDRNLDRLLLLKIILVIHAGDGTTTQRKTATIISC